MALCATVQDLLIHTSLFDLYNVTSDDSPHVSRETMPVADRLDHVVALAPLGAHRQPRHCSPGTCRDYAVLLAALLTQHGVEARVRCGFAAYFTAPWEDHWVTEYRDADTGAWLRADAQLDGPHRARFGIGFDIARVPADQFLTAELAWRRMRAETEPCAHFGHGEDAGAWFMMVNLARDYLSLTGLITSSWDSWRAASPRDRERAERHVAEWDSVATAIEALAMGKPAARPSLVGSPFWVT